MEINNAKQRSSEFRKIGQDCEPKSQSRVVGRFTEVSREYGINKVVASGEDRERGYPTSPKQEGGNAVDGGVIDQLVEELERQSEYHQNQVSQIESRLDELRQLSGELKKINKHD